MNRTTEQASVVTATLNPTVDKTFAVDRLLPERKLDANEVRSYPGGGGINVARAMLRLGQPALALWSAGGSTGRELERMLLDEGVSSLPIPVSESTRENLIVRDDASEQHFRFGLPGPRLTEEDRERWRGAIAELSPAPDYLVLSGSLPPDTPLSWFRELLRSVPGRSRLVVDTKREALTCAIEHGVHLIKPNLHELAEIDGGELTDEDSIRRAAQRPIREGRVQVVVVSLGRGGALLATAEEVHWLGSPPVPLASKVGAGDSMVAGIVTALSRGATPLDAARFGVAAGAAAVMTEGTELCRRSDTERLHRQVRAT